MVQESFPTSPRTVVITPPSVLAVTAETTTNGTGITQVKDGSLETFFDNIYASRSSLASLRADPALARTITRVDVRNSSSAATGTTNNRASPKDMICLLRDIGETCPCIETLSFDASSSTPGQPALEVPIAALTAFFEQVPQHLVSLKISSAMISTTGGSPDFKDLEKAVRQATSWKDMRLEFCEPAEGTPTLDPLLQCLSAAPALEQLTLSGTTLAHTAGGINLCAGPSLAKLARNNNTLRTLTIWGGKRHMLTKDVCALVNALETNKNLTELTLHARGLNATCGRALSRCLMANTTLERLILNVGDNQAKVMTPNGKSDYVITTTLLAKALQCHNRTLRMLSLDHCPEEDSDGYYAVEGDSHDYDFYEYLLQLDHHCQSLLRRNAETVRKAYTQMLHCNPVLEVLWMNLDNEEEGEGDDEDIPSSMIVTSEMEMLLRLNRHGIRQTLFSEKADTVSSKEWVDAIASQSYDINALLYLMSRNPSLCSTNPPPRPTNNKRESPAKETEAQPSTMPARALKKQRTQEATL